jgi:hypothetical protein
VQHEEGVGAVPSVAEAVVRQHPEGAGLARHRLDAGEALQRLAPEREGEPGGSPVRRGAGGARHALRLVDALVAGPGESAREREAGRRALRRRQEGGGRQDRVAGQHRIEPLLGLGGGRRGDGAGGEAQGRREQAGAHGRSSRPHAKGS